MAGQKHSPPTIPPPTPLLINRIPSWQAYLRSMQSAVLRNLYLKTFQWLLLSYKLHKGWLKPSQGKLMGCLRLSQGHLRATVGVFLHIKYTLLYVYHCDIVFKFLSKRLGIINWNLKTNKKLSDSLFPLVHHQAKGEAS